MAQQAVLGRTRRTKDQKRTPGQHRAHMRLLTAAATRVRLDKEMDVMRQRYLRREWQLEAFVFRNTIPELRFAFSFKANCASRVRFFIAAIPDGPESDEPVEINKLEAGTVPPQIMELCEQAMVNFGNGRSALSGHAANTSNNLSIAGEAYILGQEDPDSLEQTWSIRSVSEIQVYGGRVVLAETPVNQTGILGYIPLDPDFTTLTRMWQPDPQYRLLADSEMRAILNECDSLTILRRTIRAVARNQLSTRGLLCLPEEMDLAQNFDDNGDPEGDTFMEDFTNAIVASIVDEGSSNAAVPLVFRGPAEYIAAIRWIDFTSQFDENSGKTRDELVGNIATGLDLPKSIVTGTEEANHWSAYVIDDNTFRYHLEPHIIRIADCWTDGFLRPFIEGSNVDPALIAQWAPKLCFWYDATALVTHPDQTANATLLHAAIAISDEAYRRVLGFSEDDAPSAAEIELRMVRTVRQWPLNLLMSLMHELDPSLSVPPITVANTVPGIKPGLGGGADVPLPPPEPVVTTAPTTVSSAPAAVPDVNATGEPPLPAVTASAYPAEYQTYRAFVNQRGANRQALKDIVRDEITARFGYDPYELAASAYIAKTREELKEQRDKPQPVPSDKMKKLSRQLTKIDADLRSRLVVAANAELQRHFEKAGNQIRNKITRNAAIRASTQHLASTKSENLLQVLDRETVEALGLTAADLLATDYEALKDKFVKWTTDAANQAVRTAARMADIDEDEAVAASQTSITNNVAAGWATLESAMGTLANSLAYSAAPGVSAEAAQAAMNADTLVPTGVVRCALGVAGGASEQDFGVITTSTGAEVAAIPLGTPVGGVATGAMINQLLSQNNVTTADYEFVHGPSDKPFEPHLDLDGLTFGSFTDSALANNGDFPSNAYFFPGDHSGCLCDVTALYAQSQ